MLSNDQHSKGCESLARTASLSFLLWTCIAAGEPPSSSVLVASDPTHSITSAVGSLLPKERPIKQIPSFHSGEDNGHFSRDDNMS